MPTRRSLLAGASAGAIAMAGCLFGDPPESDDDGQNDDPTESPTSVEYVVRTGSVPEAFTSATVTLQSVFVEREQDLGPCYPKVFEGPYKPTITPLATPIRDCKRSEAFEVDLTELEGEHILGEHTETGLVSGHAFIATSVEGRDENGDAITAIKNRGGAVLIESAESPDESYGVELSIETVEDERDYDYWFVWEEFDPET